MKNKSLMEELRKKIRKILMEALAKEHFTERVIDRFLTPDYVTVGYEIPGRIGEYEEVGRYKLPEDIKMKVKEVSDLIQKYNFPKSKSYAIKITDIPIDKNKVEYNYDFNKEYVFTKNPILLFVDKVTNSNGNQIYAIIRANAIETAFFAKSYSMGNVDPKDKMRVDVFIKNLDIIKQNKVR